MTKQELEQIRTIPLEIKQLQDELDRLPAVRDSVSGSRLAVPYNVHAVIIEGVDIQKAERLRGKIRKKLSELQSKLEEMEDWLDRIEDSEARTILRMYYRNRMPQQKIADELGYDRSSVSKKMSKIFESD